MGTGASKKPKVENKQLKPARSKLMAAVALAKPGAVPGLCPLLKIASLLQWFSVTSLIESFKEFRKFVSKKQYVTKVRKSDLIKHNCRNRESSCPFFWTHPVTKYSTLTRGYSL